MNKTIERLPNNHRVKVFDEDYPEKLENKVNSFLSASDAKVLDIEYSCCNSNYNCHFSAIILYTLNDSVLDKKFE